MPSELSVPPRGQAHRGSELRRYGLGYVRPAPLPIAAHLRSGYLKRGTSLDQLARSCGIDPSGLYAAGADMASLFAGHYPSGGINLGPALTFGYIAGRHIAGALGYEQEQAQRG